MVQEESLRGVTSNPAIFEKSILGSADYDAELKALADEGKTAREIYRSMALHDVQAACDVLRPVYDATNGARRLRVLGGRAAARPRHRGHARAGPDVLGPGRPPEPDDQDPGHRGGPAGDRGGAVRRPQHQRHAAVQRRRLREGHGGLHPRDGAAPRGRQAAGPPLGRLVLRLARGHRGRQAPRGRGQHGPAGHGRAGQRPRRLQGVRAGLRRRALRGAARGRLPGPAPAVGVDRRQEPELPADAVRLGPRRPRHGQHDAAAGAAGRGRARRGHRRDRRRRPDARPRRRWPTPGSTWTT